MMKQKIVKISIICASHNGKYKLPKLIESISNGYYIPEEIIIVTTSLSDCLFLNKKISNKIKLKFFISKKKNQIYQRKLGIKKTKNNLILQVDDDVLFYKDTLKNFFYNNFFTPKKKILASYVKINHNKHQSYRFSEIYNKNIFFRLVLRLLNNFKKNQNFSITKSGRILPLIKFKNSKRYYNVDWLNSVMFYNKRYAKYPNINFNSTKSYYEDVIFSNYNKVKGSTLIIPNNIKIYHPITSKTDFKTFFKSIRNQYLMVKFLKKNFILFILDVIIFSVVFLIYR